MSGFLNEEERVDVAKRATPALRSAATGTRALLRCALSLHTGIPPQKIAFGRNQYGKPHLASGSASSIAFNLSHSGETLAIAVCAAGEVGLDVEHPRSDIVREALAARVCAPGELAHFAALPRAEQVELFYRIWTAKEAFSKALGRGFSLGFTRFSVEPPQAEWPFPGLDLIRLDEVLGIPAALAQPASLGTMPVLLRKPHPLHEAIDALIAKQGTKS